MKTKNGIILTVTVLAIVIACSCKPKDNCCKQYDPQTEQSTYCNKHRTAAFEFVLVTQDSLSLENFELLKILYNKIEKCPDVVCIEQAIDADPALERLQQKYEIEHQAAETSTNLPTDQKHKLVICGFSNAIDDVETNLKQEGQ